MSEALSTFSESWYRIASQRISLRPSVKVRRQNFRDRRWIVIENPFSNEFFRLTPGAYDFVGRLRPDRTVEEVWNECLERFPDEAPGQEEVIQLLSQLYHANLLQYRLADDAAQLFKRFEKRRQRETRSRWLNVMFMRFPLLDPDQFLVRTLPVVGKFISPLGALLWLGVILSAIKMGVDNFPALRNGMEGVLAPANLPLLYIGMIIVKTLHEFGHAYGCRKFGGEVHVMGVMLLIFTPVPYMDATSSWGFRSRAKRMLVGAAGMIVEIFIAALAMFVWANTGQGTLHSLAYNIMFVASISTLLFNINPLLRFDGYYMLSDWLDIPNLHQRALKQLGFIAERFLFGIKTAFGPALSRKEAWWLVAFGISSSIYRVIVFGGILLLVADRFLLIGLAMAVVCLVAWIAVPVVKLVRYLAASPRLARHRPRAIAVTVGGIAGILLVLQFVPVPHHFRAPGVIESREWIRVFNEAPGYLDTILAAPGARVSKDQPLLTLRNSDVEFELAAARASVAEIEARLREATQARIANLKPLKSLLETAKLRLARIEKDEADLIIRAQQDGIWVVPHPEEFRGRWIDRGTELGLIINHERFRFVATVAQKDGDRLFSRKISGAEVRLQGQSAVTLPSSTLTVIPAEQRNLPSAAVGWAGGGDVPVSSSDPSGIEAVEPFFEVRADVVPQIGARLLHGRAGKIRFDLAPEPLLPRWMRRLRQVLQKRYQL